MPELLAELFSSRVRAAVLALMLPRPHLGFSLTELARRLAMPVSSLQHECYKLNRLGLLKVERAGSARRYRPDPTFPLLPALSALILRSISLEEALYGAAERMEGIEHVWVSGSLDEPDGGTYLVVVGVLDLESLDGLFDRSRSALAGMSAANRLELAYYLPGDWNERLAAGDPFVTELRNAPRIDLLASASGCPQADPEIA